MARVNERQNANNSRSDIPLILGWVLAFLVRFLLRQDFLLPHPYLPALPNVAAPFDPSSDVVSVVPYLFRALFVAAVAVLIAEVAKYQLIKKGGPARGLWLILVYQVVLFVDYFRAYAYDLFIYSASFARILSLREGVPNIPQRWVPIPWMSLLVLIGLIIYVGLPRRSNTLTT